MPVTLVVANSSISLMSVADTHKILMLHKVFYCVKLSNKQSTKVICRSDRLRTAHSKSQKALWVMECIPAAHTLDYILLRITLPWSLVKTLLRWWIIIWTIIGACNASYILPYRYTPGITNLCFYSSHIYYCIAILIQSAYKK